MEKDGRIGKIDSLLGADCTIKGDISLKGSIRLDGKLEGSLQCADGIEIGPTGEVVGNCKAKNVVIAGKVDGNIDCEGRLEVTSTGRVVGDLRTTRLVLAEGSLFRGNCNMGDIPPLKKVVVEALTRNIV